MPRVETWGSLVVRKRLLKPPGQYDQTNYSSRALPLTSLIMTFTFSWHPTATIWSKSLFRAVRIAPCQLIMTPLSKYFTASQNFSCNQAALQMVFSVCPSVCLSVCPFVTSFDYVPIIVSSWNFQELLPMTKVRSMQNVKVRGQRSRSQRSQPNLTVSGLQLQFFRRGALLFFKVIRQISRSHGSKNRRIWPKLGVSGL